MNKILEGKLNPPSSVRSLYKVNLTEGPEQSTKHY